MTRTSSDRPTGVTQPAGFWTRLVHRIAHVDTPRRTAAAFALGVFLSFSPFLGFQTAIGLGTALLLRLRKIAVLAGLCTNLPWIMVPWYALTTAAAAALFRTPVAANLDESLARLFDVPVYRAAFWTGAAEILAPFFWSFIVGSTVGAMVVGAIAYVVTRRVIVRIRHEP